MIDDTGKYISKPEEWEMTFFKNGFYGKKHQKDHPRVKTYEPTVSWQYFSLINSLSKTMKGGLINLLENKANIPLKTISALRKRKLLNETDYKLTELGKILAISLLSLDRQCEILGLDLKRISPCDNYQRRIEFNVLDYYKNHDYFGFYSEGSLIFDITKVFIMCALYSKSIPFFDSIDELRIKFSGSYILTREFSDDFYHEIIYNIETANDEIFREHFEISKSIQKQSTFKFFGGEMNRGPQEYFAEYDTEEVLLFMRVFGRNNFRKVFEKFNQKALDFSGWPDLLIFNHKEFMLVEVKKSDKLIPSQIITLPKLKSLDLGVEINKCVKKK